MQKSEFVGMFADLRIGVYRGGSLRKIGQEECLKQRKIKNCKSRCRIPSKQRNFDSGK